MRLINSLLFILLFSAGVSGFYFSDKIESWVNDKIPRKSSSLKAKPDSMELLVTLEALDDAKEIFFSPSQLEPFSLLSSKETLGHLSQIKIIDQSKARLGFIQSGYKFILKGPIQAWIESFDPLTPLSPVYIHIDQPNIELEQDGVKNKVYILYQSHAYSTDQLKQITTLDQKISLKPNTQSQIGFLKISLNATKANEPKKRALPNAKKSYDEYIDQEIANASELFSKCRDNRILEVGPVKGKVVIGIRVNSEGLIDQIKIVKSEISDEPLITCLKTTLSRLELAPHNEEPIYRLVPLEFE